MNTEYINFAEPPGSFIREELEARGWSQRDLAYILGMPEQGVNQIISGKRGISAGMAKALAQAFDVSPEFFTNLQNVYDLARANNPDPSVAKRGRIQDHYPLREMIKRGWFIDSDAAMLETQLTRFFEVKSFNDVPHLAHAAKRSNYDDFPPSQLAWLFRVRQIANTMVVPRYSKKALEESIVKMANMRSEPEEVRHIPRLLHDAGVRFVAVEGLPSGKIDGVCFWIKNSPVIGMSLRFDRIDNFWFVLRHEIEHVLNKHGQKREIIDIDIESSGDSGTEEERMANRVAAEFCVEQDKVNAFYIRKKPFFSEKDIIAFARRLETHPGIIVGQIQHRTGRWDFLRRHQVKIRHHLSLALHMDGWGDVVPVEL